MEITTFSRRISSPEQFGFCRCHIQVIHTVHDLDIFVRIIPRNYLNRSWFLIPADMNYPAQFSNVTKMQTQFHLRYYNFKRILRTVSFQNLQKKPYGAVGRGLWLIYFWDGSTKSNTPFAFNNINVLFTNQPFI